MGPVQKSQTSSVFGTGVGVSSRALRCPPKTLGADMDDNTKAVVAEIQRIGVTPHLEQNTARSAGSANDGRSSRHVVLHQIEQ